MVKKEIIPTDENELEVFLAQPKKKIMSSIIDLAAGAVTTNKNNWVGKISRVAKATLNQKGVEQFAKEISALQEEGKIKSESFDNDNIAESFIDVLDIIENGSENKNKLEAIKSIFYASLSEEEKNDNLNYQLLKLAMRLSSNQLLILKTCYDLKQNCNTGEVGSSFDKWVTVVTKKMGCKIGFIVAREDDHLVQEGLLGPRLYNDKSGINSQNFRLTELGIEFCNKINKYNFNNLIKNKPHQKSEKNKPINLK